MRIDEILARLSPAIGEKRAHRLWLLYSLEEDLEKRREIEGLVHALAARHLDQFFSDEKILLAPPKSFGESGFLLGTVFHGSDPRGEFRLPENLINQHVFVGGVTGTGKSNFCRFLLRQFLERSIPFTLYSWKREYRGVMHAGWPNSERLKLYTVGRDVAPFSFNPFQTPPQTSKEIWVGRIADIASHGFYVGHGVRYLLHEILLRLDDPTPQSVFEELGRVKAVGRKREWLDSAMRCVGELCIGPGKSAFKQHDAVSIQDLLDGFSILELDALSEDAKTFFVESFIAWMHQYRLAHGRRSDLCHVSLLEEAHRMILDRGKQQGEGVMDLVFREIRELGEGVIFFDQNVSTLSKAATGNASTTLLFRQKHGDDLKAGADLVLLDFTKRLWLGRLPVGWAIVKTPEDGPFLMKVPAVESGPATVSDDEIRAQFLRDSGSDHKIPANNDVKDLIPPIPGREERNDIDHTNLDDVDVRLLEDVAVQMSGVVERYARLGISRSKGNSAKSTLVQLGLIKELAICGGGHSTKMLELTEKGRKFLECRGFKSLPRPSFIEGGAEHRFWKQKIAKEIEDAGIQVTQESRLASGGSTDIVAREGSNKIAFEIETGNSNVKKNVKKNHDSGTRTVVLVPTSRRARAKILNQLMKAEQKEHDRHDA